MKRFLLAICAVLCLTDVYAQRERTDNLDSIVVAANKTREVKRTQISAVSLPASVMFAMPATMGEPDVLKSLQMIPGVIGAGDGNVALHIRGGSSSQNLFIVDGAVLYNPEHFKGYVSAFNPVAVNDVLLFKGGFPAQYGNRLSGIVDTELKRGDFNIYHGTANVGMFAASAMASGPIIKDKLSFMVAGRRSFYKEVTSKIVDWLYKKEEDREEGIQYSSEPFEIPFDDVTFYDFNAKLSYKPNKHNIIDVSFYKGRDINDLSALEESEIDEVGDIWRENYATTESAERWGNILAIANWNYAGDKINAKTDVSYSFYDYKEFFYTLGGYKNIRKTDNKLLKDTYSDVYSQYKSSVNRLQLSNLTSINTGKLKGLEVGLELAHISYNPYYYGIETKYVKQLSDDNYFETLDTIATGFKGGKRHLTTGGLFANYNFKSGKAIEIDAGLRVSFHVTDGKTYIYPEPRVNALFNISNKLALKASYSMMSQSEHKVSTADLLEDADIWMPSGNGINPSKSHQVAAGIFYDFKSEKGYAVSLEGYYKTMNDILEYKEGAISATNTEDWERSIAVGDGRAYGVEFLAQKDKGKTQGWLSYTWSKSLEKFNRAGMIINKGEEFYAPHDCRHSLTVNLTQKISENIDFTATFSYHTGRYRTLYNFSYLFNPDRDLIGNGGSGSESSIIDIAPKRNNIKLDDYHKLDIAFNYYIPHKTGKSTIVIGVTNLYNNYNISYIRQALELKKICLFPVMPSLSYSYSF